MGVLRPLRTAIVWLLTLLTLALLAASSSFVTWLLAEDRALYAWLTWQFTMIAVALLGTIAFIAAWRPRVAVLQFVLSIGAYYAFFVVQVVMVRAVSILALIPLGALNLAAATFAWELLLKDRRVSFESSPPEESVDVEACKHLH